MKLEQEKEELDKQLRQTQEAVLAGKRKVENLREEVQRRTEARTASLVVCYPCLCHVATVSVLAERYCVLLYNVLHEGHNFSVCCAVIAA